MKKIIFLALLAAVMLAVCACGNTGKVPSITSSTSLAQTQAATTSAQTTAGLEKSKQPEGYVPVEGPSQIEAQLDLFIVVPQKATEVTYGIVKDQYAYMTFTYDGVEYRYEVGKGEHSLAADTTAYAQTKNADWLDYPYTMAWTEGGAGMADWYDKASDAEYRVSALSGITQEKLSTVAVVLLPAG